MENLSDNIHTSFEEIRENYLRICDDISKASADAGRSDTPRIMAVTKTVSPERINYAIGLGIDLLGENRVQEYMDKRGSYSEAEVHFIGALQTNKVKYIIDKVSMIHSVDSLKLAAEIDRRAEQHGLVMDILTEINIGEEETKSGVSAQSAIEFCREIAEFKNIRLRGLMCIPPPGCAESVFASMQELFEKIKSDLNNRNNKQFDTLSMGMSGDYAAAAKHGATIVRIGSALFGYRKY